MRLLDWLFKDVFKRITEVKEEVKENRRVILERIEVSDRELINNIGQQIAQIKSKKRPLEAKILKKLHGYRHSVIESSVLNAISELNLAGTPATGPKLRERLTVGEKKIVSRASLYRYLKSLMSQGLIEKSGKEYRITPQKPDLVVSQSQSQDKDDLVSIET